MGNLGKHLLFALLGSVAHALPSTSVDQAGPGGAGRGGRVGGGHGGGGGQSRGGKSGGFRGGSHPALSPNPNWRHDLDLDRFHPACPPDYPEILFYDNFGSYPDGSQPSPDKWQIDLGTQYPSLNAPPQWGTGEIQVYTSSTDNLVIDDGVLRITPIRPATEQDVWTSARIETTEEWDFRAEPGKKIRIQAAIKLGDEDPDRQLGIWPAFWSLGSDYRGVYNNWPQVGEIDILESVNGLPLAWQVLHCGFWIDGDNGPCNEPDGIASPVPSEFERGVWHVVSVDIDRTNPGGNWQDEEIVWRIDGEVVFTVTGADVGDETSWTNISNKDHMILLNVAVGGSFPNKVAGFDTPTEDTVGGIDSSMWVKYVIVYGN
ncbi:glucan endo-1,3-beta-glucosidase A1-like protein [Naviculisporaceae sp. PSN 640]